MNDKISDKDKSDWENFLKSKEKIFDKDYKKKKIFTYSTKSLDLHGYTLEEANVAVEKFIIKSFSEKINKLTVVTGKGIHSDNEKNPYTSKDLGILKYSLPDYIKSNPELMELIAEIKDAEIEDGGSGAFYIFLKKLKTWIVSFFSYRINFDRSVSLTRSPKFFLT